MAQLSVIIINWNTKNYLDRCLTELFKSSRSINLDVCIVDNASSDRSVEMVREKYPQARLLVNASNVGFGRANNQAIQTCHSPYVLLLNSDAFLKPGALDVMLRLMDTYPDTGALACKLLYEDGTLQRSCQSFPDLWTELWQTLMLDKVFPKSKIFGKFLLTYWAMDDFREVDTVMGAVMLLRAKAIDQVGLFDEQFFMYSEEVDLCHRLKKRGWKVRYTPEAEAIHIWGGSARQVPVNTIVRLYKSRTLFFRKYYGLFSTWLFKGLLWLESLGRITGGYLVYGLSRRSIFLEKARNYRYLITKIWSF